MMDATFRKTGLDRAESADGTVVQGLDRERMVYRRAGLSISFEVFFRDGIAIVHLPDTLPPLPPGVTPPDVHAAMRAGVAAATGHKVR